ncbi:hypothetical protein DL98DRAFT_280643 [Cadophora sp. DSE1049]|nr:hypothetical protein DL98DRAFT_280643 [Cadophora sp. DSE1049]
MGRWSCLEEGWEWRFLIPLGFGLGGTGILDLRSYDGDVTIWRTFSYKLIGGSGFSLESAWSAVRGLLISLLKRNIRSQFEASLMRSRVNVTT